jgi:hypothetical protein
MGRLPDCTSTDKKYHSKESKMDNKDQIPQTTLDAATAALIRRRFRAPLSETIITAKAGVYKAIEADALTILESVGFAVPLTESKEPTQ